jgi:alcohol oxidase
MPQISEHSHVDGRGNPMLPEGKYMAMAAYLNYPQSRGCIHIVSKDSDIPPDFDAGFLSRQVDIAPQILAYKKNREVARRMNCFIEEYEPSRPAFASDSKALGPESSSSQYAGSSGISTEEHEVKDFEYSKEDDRVLAEWVKNGIETAWHSMYNYP